MDLIMEITLGVDYSSSASKNPQLEDFIKTFDRSPDREISLICASFPWLKNYVNRIRRKLYSSNLSRKVRIIEKLTNEVLRMKESRVCFSNNDINFIRLFLTAELEKMEDEDLNNGIDQMVYFIIPLIYF